MKKIIALGLFSIIIFLSLTGCSFSNRSDLKNINLVSREDGSGTRKAFTELLGVLKKEDNGNEIDETYEEAIIQNTTNSVIRTVESDKNSIGYISIGSLNNTVKTLKIDGVEATPSSVKDGSYKISRPFNIVYSEDIDNLTKDFITFLLSNETQDIVKDMGYTSVDSKNKEYNTKNLKGSLVVAGSTSVTPVMEKAAEKYKELNPSVSVEIQSTGSSAGIQSAIEGSAHIGMSSRELDDDEKEKLLFDAIAIDGIAVIVNMENSLDSIKLEDLRKIYIGEITSWDNLK